MVSPIIAFVAGAVVGYIAGYSTPKPTAARATSTLFARRAGVPKTEAERRATHAALYGTTVLPPRGTRLGIAPTVRMKGETPAVGTRAGMIVVESGLYYTETPRKPVLLKGGSWPHGAKSTYLSEGKIVETPRKPALFRGQTQWPRLGEKQIPGVAIF